MDITQLNTEFTPHAIRERLIVALDMSFENVVPFVTKMGDSVSFYKVGFELFLAAGLPVLEFLAEQGKSIFLDLKLHDIPNTVKQALRVIKTFPHVRFTTVHALGGKKMLETVHETLAGSSLLPLAVTVLTSHSEEEWKTIVPSCVENSVATLANMAYQAGIGGFVCSAFEAQIIKNMCNPCVTVCPGIRLSHDEKGDQSRIMTPLQALHNGADYIVIGRSITTAEDPRSVVESICNTEV